MKCFVARFQASSTRELSGIGCSVCTLFVGRFLSEVRNGREGYCIEAWLAKGQTLIVSSGFYWVLLVYEHVVS